MVVAQFALHPKYSRGKPEGRNLHGRDVVSRLDLHISLKFSILLIMTLKSCGYAVFYPGNGELGVAPV